VSPAPRTIPSKAVGVEVGALSQTIDARWLMAYAAALGERDPRYYDTTSPSGPASHVLFPVCYEWPPILALRAKTIPEDLFPLGVHASHHLVVHRRPEAGDRLLTRASMLGVRPSRAGTFVLMRLATVDRNGRPVTTTDYGSVFRGVGTPGAVASTTAPLPAPEMPADDAVRWRAPLTVPVWAAQVYSECARIWNPIHTDLAVARAAGLPGPILHGTATLALAVSEVVRQDLDGDPARVKEIAARFTGMVAVPSSLTVCGRGRAGDRVAFDAVDERGQTVLSDGVLRSVP